MFDVEGFVEKVWRDWTRTIPEEKIALKWPSLRGIVQWYVRECERRGLDPEEAIDLEAQLDPSLTYAENKKILESLLISPLSEKEIGEQYKQYKMMMLEEVREKYPEIINELEERLVELERKELTSKRRYKKIKQLERELAETKRLLEEEKARPPEVPPIKVRILKAFTEGIIDYTPGSVIETRDLDWVIEKVQRGLVEKVGLEVPVEIREPPKPLTREETRMLEDEFKATLMDELGRIPRDVMAEFRVTLRRVMDRPYEEALRVIREKAREIATRETLRKAIKPTPAVPKERVYRVPEEVPREERAEPPFLGVAPAVFPSAPLSDLPFPRRPSSEEKIKLWDAFAYALQEKGINFWDYGDVFRERIEEVTFRDWDMLRDRFFHLIGSIVKGEELPPMWVWRGAPPPSLEFLWRPTIEPTKARKQAIRHFTSVVIRNARGVGAEATLDDLRKMLEQFGVRNVTYDEIQDAIMEGYEQKDPYFVNISLEELQRFLES